ncbi:MAG: hypothetical protein SPK23_00305 [Eubacteriales bacterium]|nr:hypothetical protein [Eubacteriales bacterium]
MTAPPSVRLIVWPQTFTVSKNHRVPVESQIINIHNKIPIQNKLETCENPDKQISQLMIGLGKPKIYGERLDK